MFGWLKRRIKLKKRNAAWKKMNPHNETAPDNDFNMADVSVGKYTYGAIRVYNYNSGEKLKIGNFCSIASDVMFVLNADHNIHTISSFPFKAKCLYTGEQEALSKGDIVVDDDVWIGYRSTILSGVHVGQGAVIAAGSVVTKNVPPYAVVAGVPAKVIKYRFDPEIINELIRIDYSKLTKEDIQEHIDDLYKDLIDVQQIAWMPKKNL